MVKTERDEDDHVRVTVQDSGVGFDPDVAEKLFEAFYTTTDDGMGIGLCVSRSIIESHGGRLWAAPNDGPGATFSFSIPRAPGSLTGVGTNRDVRTPAVTDAAGEIYDGQTFTSISSP
jgi:signal transduction histidine kinase